MFLTSTLINASLLYISLVTSSILKERVNSDTDYANLEFALNFTNPILLINQNDTANVTTTPADVFYGDDNVAWPDIAAPPSLTLPLLNASLAHPRLGAPSVRCNGKAYGKNLKILSCLEALSKMPKITKTMTFGERGRGDWDGVLPYRILSADGLCAIDISHKANTLSDKISPSDLRQSVELVIEICLKTKPNEGGVITNLGQNGDLAVRVMPYRPSVRCGQPYSNPPVADCRMITDLMPADARKETFGQKSDTDPKITVKLPASFQMHRKRCEVVIDTLLPGEGQDTCDWYKIWAAATAIEYMCVYSGRNGMALEIGQSAECPKLLMGEM